MTHSPPDTSWPAQEAGHDESARQESDASPPGITRNGFSAIFGDVDLNWP
jgi:hypothetical protein